VSIPVVTQTITTIAALSTNDSCLGRVVPGKYLQLSSQCRTLEAIKKRFDGSHPKRFAVKHKVVLLAAQGHEVKPECLSSRPCGDAAIGLSCQYGMRR
jgi:hypothetical protein